MRLFAGDNELILKYIKKLNLSYTVGDENFRAKSYVLGW